MELTLPIHTINELNGSHQHWSKVAKRRKKTRADACMCVMLSHKPPLPVVVTMTRVSAGELDDDGLRAALKSVRDGIADAYGVADNGPEIEWRYGQTRGARKIYGIQIKIDPAATLRPAFQGDGNA